MNPFPPSILPTDPEHRERFKALLEQGLPRLWNGIGKPNGVNAPEVGREEYICNTTLTRPILSKPKPLAPYIQPMLGDCFTLEEWLMYEARYIGSEPAMQAYRKAWMEQLIKELS